MKCLDSCLDSAREVKLFTAHRYYALFDYMKGHRPAGVVWGADIFFDSYAAYCNKYVSTFLGEVQLSEIRSLKPSELFGTRLLDKAGIHGFVRYLYELDDAMRDRGVALIQFTILNSDRVPL